MNSKSKLLIIGGGFYGCEIATYLSKYFKKVTIIEESNELLQRASYVNQARIHNGYHYPRNYLTALRSHINFTKFIKDYKFCIDDSFLKLYAIARNNSKVSAAQFENYIKKIQSPLKDASPKAYSLFNTSLVEKVYEAHEVAFDAVRLKKFLKKKLKDNNVKVLYNTSVKKIHNRNESIEVILDTGLAIQADFVFNCTYARINTILKNSQLPLIPLKHELIEMALIQEPKEIEHIGITLMDGPFFSTMPFPSTNYHSLSHVRYTPIANWTDFESFKDPYLTLENTKLLSKYNYMIKDAQRYLPVLEKAKYIKSLYEIKTVLIQNESDDGRPILYRKNYGGVKGLFVIMGGKIDNIYDICEKLQEEFN